MVAVRKIGALPRFMGITRVLRLVIALVGVSILGSCGTSLATLYLVAASQSRPPPVIIKDEKGRPFLIRQTGLAGHIDSDVHRETFARAFWDVWLFTDGKTVDVQLKKALNLMAPRWRQEVLVKAERIKKRKGLHWEDRNLQLQPGPDAAFKVRVGEDEKFYAHSFGSMVVTPSLKPSDVDLPPPQTMYFYAWLQFEPTSVSILNHYGYRVLADETYIFGDKDEYELFLKTKKAAR